MIQHEYERLQELLKLSTDLAEVKDFDVLMERILKAARDFVGCDAGSIYIREGNRLKFSYTQNDTLQSRLETGRKLLYNTFTVPISNESIAGYVALTGEMLNIPDAYALSGSLPYRFDRSFDENARYRTLSILTVPLKKNNNQVIGVLQLINARSSEGTIIPFDPGVEFYVTYFASNAAVGLERAQLMRGILLRMISMAELRDPSETGIHVNRVGGYSVEIFDEWARENGLSRTEIDKQRDTLRMAAMLHDVGKVAISDTILKKPGRLDVEEFETMKMHTVLGARLFLNTFSDLEVAARDVALNHHEKFNGAGYPGHVDPFTGKPVPGKTDSDGRPLPKRGEDIPLFGRIVALADVYDALSSQRSYKKAFDEDRVLSIIHEESGKHFDPEIAAAFFSALPSIHAISRRYE
ncbi:HD domain-containing protein [bacterium]|nr:HD domain-containing protein [bacterium]